MSQKRNAATEEELDLINIMYAKKKRRKCATTEFDLCIRQGRDIVRRNKREKTEVLENRTRRAGE